jgi:hypothetical protein
MPEPPVATTQSAVAATELSASGLGVFTGTVMGTAPGGPPTTSQFATATVSKNETGVSISFSGGIPAIDEKIPPISHLQFVSGGSGDDTYKSNGEKGSVAGVDLSVLSPTPNVENVEVGGTTIIFTGAKCDAFPELPACICVTHPTNPMCQPK